MEGSARQKSITMQMHNAVISCVCYFDVFNFPLKAEEIKRFCQEEMSEQELSILLEDIVESGKLKKLNDYYILPLRDIQSVKKREENELRLSREQQKIKKYAKKVSSFPFVEAAFVSGSVSKGVMDKKGDVDYFIIASPGRLWVCRTLLVLYRKIFLLNSRKYFCTNYFIDTNNLRVPDTNVFVATEIATLRPIKESFITDEFYKSNAWVNEWLPNNNTQHAPLLHSEAQKPFLSRWMEQLFSGQLGEQLDKLFLRLTIKRWKMKFPHFSELEFDTNLRSYRNVSKSHANGNQFMVLQELNERVKKFS